MPVGARFTRPLNKLGKKNSFNGRSDAFSCRVQLSGTRRPTAERGTGTRWPQDKCRPDTSEQSQPRPLDAYNLLAVFKSMTGLCLQVQDNLARR